MLVTSYHIHLNVGHFYEDLNAENIKEFHYATYVVQKLIIWSDISYTLIISNH